MARDRTARVRIRDLLATAGPVVDPSGYATAALKDAIEYQGSNAAFIQLIAAMERDNEIEREIRGKRTYRISATETTLESSPAIPPSGGPVVTAEGFEFDYDALAKALIREFWKTAQAVAAVDVGARAGSPAEADYTRRLEAARQKLDELLTDGAPPSERISR